MAIYFQGAGEHLLLFSGIRGASSLFWGFREPCKKVKKNLTLKEKPSFQLILKKNLRLLWGKPPNPLRKSTCIYFRANMLIWIGISLLVTDMANNFYYFGK